MINKNFINKSVFDVLIGGVYDFDNNQFNEVIKLMNYFHFITSLSLTDIYSYKSDSDNKNVIAATNFFIGDLSIDYITNNLTHKCFSHTELYIIYVSWLDTISLNTEIVSRELEINTEYGHTLKIITKTMGYKSFFSNLKSMMEYRSDLESNNKNYLGINPIIIFSGLH